MEEKILQPHEQRVIDEKDDLESKIKKLGPFILDNPIFKTLPEEEQKDLNNQYDIMNQYLYILQKRINQFYFLLFLAFLNKCDSLIVSP